MTIESPDTVHGRMKEGAYLAGHSLQRAMESLKYLLKDGRWKELSNGYKNVNEFLRDTGQAFNLLKIDPSERKEIAQLVMEITEGEASQRAIADMVGVKHTTIGEDLGTIAKDRGVKTPETSVSAEGGAVKTAPQPPLELVEVSPEQLAKQERRKQERKADKAIRPAQEFINTVGDSNAAIFADILQLYVPEKSKVLDTTWGSGVFWANVDESKYRLTRSDFEDRPGVDRTADFTDLPDKDNTFDAVIFDPPYKLTGTPEDTDRYRNMTGAWKDVRRFYSAGIAECYRVLKIGGVLIVKLMDQVVSGKQEWYHRYVYDDAIEFGMTAEDLFVVIRANPTPQPADRKQVHAHKNHSFFWVFRK